MNPVEASAAVRDQSVRECAATLAIWENGINLLIRALDPLKGCLTSSPKTTGSPRAGNQPPTRDVRPDFRRLLLRAILSARCLSLTNTSGYFAEDGPLVLLSSRVLCRAMNSLASRSHSLGIGSPGRHLAPGLSSQLSSNAPGTKTNGTRPGIGGEYLMTWYGCLVMNEVANSDQYPRITPVSQQ
jgi:hypothetical protein